MLALGVLLVFAAPAPVELDWVVPPGCPDADAVRQEAERRSQKAGDPVRARGTVKRSEEGFVLELTLEGEGGTDTRRVEARTCDALAEAAGLFIAIAADPSLAAQPEEPGEPSVNPVQTQVVPEAQPETEAPRRVNTDAIAGPYAAPREVRVHQPPVRRLPLRAVIRVYAAGQFLRLMPSAAGVGFGGALGLLGPLFRVELRAQYFVSQDESYDLRPDIGGRVDLWTLGPHGCFEPVFKRLTFPLCGGLEIGGMRGRGSGVDAPGDATTAYLGLPIDASLTWAPIPNLALYGGAQVALALRRPQFHVRGEGELFRAGPAAIRAIAGVEVRFP